MELFTNQLQKLNDKNKNLTNKTYELIIKYGIAIKYAVTSFLLLGVFAYIAFKIA